MSDSQEPNHKYARPIPINYSYKPPRSAVPPPQEIIAPIERKPKGIVARAVARVKYFLNPKVWFRATIAYYMDPHESLALKSTPLVMAGYTPINIADEVIPVLGQIDDVGHPAVWFFLTIKMIFRIARHRK